MNKKVLKYHVAREFIEDGDILLYRGTGPISALVRKFGNGLYSHVGMASWNYDRTGEKSHLESLEFREWKGGRAISLANEVFNFNRCIDVYRASQTFKIYQFLDNQIAETELEFDGRSITKCMRVMTGLPYGWKRIWWITLFYVPFFRLFGHSWSVRDEEELIYPVCSTAIAHCFHKNYVDLTPHRSDNRMEPSDIARSPILNYLFTLEY